MSSSEKLDYDIIIIGGGLGGLVAGHLLQDHGLHVALIEKKTYPFHRVCGEYISNEVIPFLKGNQLFPEELQHSQIKRFRLTAVSGKVLDMELDLGGFGISRFTYDAWLASRLREKGGTVLEKMSVRGVSKASNQFVVRTEQRDYHSKMVIGAFGKRSILDKHLQRPFIAKSSPYIGVKYHVKVDYPDDLVALHNFEGGYCGINNVGDYTFNLCYLSSRGNLQQHGNIPEMERQILHQNPHLKKIFERSEFLFDRPEVINEISFEKKGPLYGEIPMIGDAAGMITPLCGNGMAMAIHAAALLAESVQQHWGHRDFLNLINRQYAEVWNRHFSNRLWVGRGVQSLFGGKGSSNFAVQLGRQIRPIAEFLMSKTHGTPF